MEVGLQTFCLCRQRSSGVRRHVHIHWGHFLFFLPSGFRSLHRNIYPGIVYSPTKVFIGFVSASKVCSEVTKQI